MVRFFGLACALLLASCAAPSGVTDRNAETGTAVIALAVDRDSQSFREVALSIRRVDHSYKTNITFTLRGMDADAPDFQTTSETGVIWTKALPAGEYQISEVVGDAGTFWWEREKRSQSAMRFNVVPGASTYVGHFRVGGAPTAAGEVSLGVSDASVADIARARSKNPDLGEVAVAVAGSPPVDAPTANSSALATP